MRSRKNPGDPGPCGSGVPFGFSLRQGSESMRRIPRSRPANIESKFAMKPILMLPPLVALAVSALWLGSRHRSCSILEEENEVLQDRIEAARRISPEEGAPFTRERGAGRRETAGKGIDWKELARLAALSGGGGDIAHMKAVIAVQKQLQELSADELIEGLDRIAGMEFSADARREIESMFIGALAQKDPERVLERYADRLDNRGLQWQITSAFQAWARKDAAAAALWMDRRIGEGKFEVKSLDAGNSPRLRFEAGLAGVLLESDPAAAAARIAALPEDQRAEVFSQGTFTLKPGTEKAYAEVVRAQVPEGEQASALARPAGRLLSQGGYAKVGDFLGAIDASRGERAAVVEESLRIHIGRGSEQKTSVEESREWILQQAPEDAGRLTGVALGQMTEWQDYPEMAERALEYRDSGGGDDVLVAFLQSEASRNHREEAVKLLERISDEAKREELRKSLEVSGGIRSHTRVVPAR